MKKERVRIKEFCILDWTIPTYGNTHILPYFTLDILGENGVESIVKTKEEGPFRYFTFCYKRYYFVNDGSMYNPKLRILEEGKKGDND